MHNICFITGDHLLIGNRVGRKIISVHGLISHDSELISLRIVLSDGKGWEG